MKAFAASEWDRAGRTLRTARQIVETDADSAASCAYYAAFHAASAMFALRGQAFKKTPGHPGGPAPGPGAPWPARHPRGRGLRFLNGPAPYG